MNENIEDQIEADKASPDLETRNRDDNPSMDSPKVVELYDANEGLVPRSGGPYLDVLQREQAEIRRAKIENREPDLENPPAVAGTVLVTKSQLFERDADRVGRIPEAMEPTVKPFDTYEADLSSAVDNEPDPRQKDWNNDTQTFRGDWDNDTQTDRGRPAENSPETPVNQENFTDNTDEDELTLDEDSE